MVLASHWTTGSEGMPPALLLLAVIPFLLVVGTVLWVWRRGWRDRE